MPVNPRQDLLLQFQAKSEKEGNENVQLLQWWERGRSRFSGCLLLRYFLLFRRDISLPVQHFWVVHSVTSTLFIYFFRSIKAAIEICSVFTAPISFNCTVTRQSIQNKIKKVNKKMKNKIKHKQNTISTSSHNTVSHILWSHWVMMTVPHVPRKLEDLDHLQQLHENLSRNSSGNILSIYFEFP